eukprot:CAMPEP_0198651504 /NCGR_PEP_ID=MMETSP1467-20131203/5727_1 /TAXON_ID=1462469 /ORGANISM="unid. sp., Strain CCMP2135" /LENGTH=42 /DNA_ID= /DNA_START= /DNA_END= /DNA_ORIENTATION=
MLAMAALSRRGASAAIASNSVSAETPAVAKAQTVLAMSCELN